MRNFFRKLNRFKDKVKLHRVQKDELRAKLVHFIEGEGAVNLDGVKGDFIEKRTFARALPSFRAAPVFAVLSMIALLGGGTAFAARNALPGDALYPFKVNVNEEVQAAFAFSKEAKAAMTAARAEARLTEAEELAARGKLNTETEAIAEAHFARFVDSAEEDIDALPMEAKADAASRFEAALKAHSRILGSFEVRESVHTPTPGMHVTTQQSGVARSIKERVDAALHGVALLRAGAETTAGVEIEATQKEAAVSKRVLDARRTGAAVRAYVTSKEEKLSSSTEEDAVLQLDAARDLTTQAEEKVKAKAYGEAFGLAGEAARKVEQVRIETQAESRIGTELRATSSPASGIKVHSESDVNGELKMNK